MLRFVALSVLLLGLAGCFSGSPGSQDGSSDRLTSSAAVAPPSPPPVVRTDTLHLLDPPHMAGLLPDGGELIRTYVPTDVDNLEGPVVVPDWSLPRPSLDTLEVTLSLVVEVQGTVTNPPRPAIGPAPLSSCFWSVGFFLQHADGSRTGMTNYCRNEGQVLSPGIQTLEQRFLLTPDAPFLPGDQFGFHLDTYGIYGPDSGVYILSGTPEHDSTLTIAELQLPLDTRTLLV